MWSRWCNVHVIICGSTAFLQIDSNVPELPEVDVEQIDLDSDIPMRDRDLGEGAYGGSPSKLDEFTIVGVSRATPYSCCVNKDCKNRKLISLDVEGKLLMECPTCKKQYTLGDSGYFYYVQLFVECKGAKTISEASIFKTEMEVILEGLDQSVEVTFDPQELKAEFDRLILGYQFRGELTNSKLRNIVGKRKFPME